ncbi:hypothetical protein CNECB9_270003 [Cupriavidus necator]|uniref:Uncharacterized protein n=1 Tax=Cupriavidus necator TaxID=106590 RepID=A0A1K0JAB6_CUPNE|nr:hypothetical protein CNECB9_270003 [Cupriavidus necator]
MLCSHSKKDTMSDAENKYNPFFFCICRPLYFFCGARLMARRGF